MPADGDWLSGFRLGEASVAGRIISADVLIYGKSDCRFGMAITMTPERFLYLFCDSRRTC